MDKGDKAYIYFVATLARYVLVPASNAREALEAGEFHPDLNGSTVLTVRIATKAEVEDMAWFENKVAQENQKR